jgi:ketosteroid isomerase-like protein
MSIDEKTQYAMQVLLDKQEIHEVLMRYCRGIDRCDEELLRGVYHPDATDDHGLFTGKAADFIPWAIKALGRDENTSHYIANELIEVEGDVAYCESYFLAVHRRREKDGTKVDLQFVGRYADRFERRQGVWKIANRQVVFDRSRIDPVGKTFSTEQYVCGKRSREDPVYKRERRA